MNRIIASIALTVMLASVASAGNQSSRTVEGTPKNQARKSTPAGSPTTDKGATSRADSMPKPIPRSRVVKTESPEKAPASKATKPSGKVRSASFQEVVDGGVIHEGEVIHEGGMVIEHDHGDSCGCDSCGSGGSSCGVGSCDLGCCDTCLQPNRLCICLPAHGWAQMDYLMWWSDPMAIPPLALSGPAAGGVPVLPTGTVLLGEGNTTGRDTMFNDRRAGGRIRFGWWLSRFPGLGIQGEYFGLGSAVETFNAQSDATTLISTPYINMNPNIGNLADVGEEFAVGHGVRYEAKSQLDAAAFHLRKSLCCGSSCRPGFLTCDPVPTQWRLDGLLGFRFMELDESLAGTYGGAIPNTTITATANDLFQVKNQFNGVDLGVQWQGRRGYWSLDLLMRMALGNTQQTVGISGSSSITNTTTGARVGGSATSGLFAAPSNVGNYSQDVFSMIPELGATLGYQLTPRIRLNVGYSFIYWSRVVRPGEQIDRELNTANIPYFLGGAPVPNPRINPDRPQFDFQETDYWLQGLNLGAEYRW